MIVAAGHHLLTRLRAEAANCACLCSGGLIVISQGRASSVPCILTAYRERPCILSAYLERPYILTACRALRPCRRASSVRPCRAAGPCILIAAARHEPVLTQARCSTVQAPTCTAHEPGAAQYRSAHEPGAATAPHRPAAGAAEVRTRVWRRAVLCRCLLYASV